VTSGKPIAVSLQSISGGDANNPLTTSMEERERCYSFVLSRTPYETVNVSLMIRFLFFRSGTSSIGRRKRSASTADSDGWRVRGAQAQK
jgi:hypothetical protein